MWLQLINTAVTETKKFLPIFSLHSIRIQTSRNTTSIGNKVVSVHHCVRFASNIFLTNGTL